MAKAWVLSHGGVDAGWPETFVPVGRSVHFYSDVAEGTVRVNGLAALSAGDIKPTQSFTGGETIPDYCLSAFSDAELMEHFASLSSRTEGRVLTVGGDLPDPTFLCSDPNNCVAPQHSAKCKGLFKQIAEDDIYLVACRSVFGGGDATTSALGTEAAHNAAPGEDEDYQAQLSAHIDGLMERAAVDPQAALAEFHGYPQGTQAALIGVDTRIENWLATMRTAPREDAADPSGIWLGDDLLAGLLGNARPKKFEKAWADDYWRNVFWTWFTGKAGGAGAQEALLTVYDLMNEYYAAKTSDAAREVVEYCEGGRGVKPACDAGAVATLRSAVDDDSGVKAAMDGLWDSVVGQLDMVYPAFYADAGELKDAIR